MSNQSNKNIIDYLKKAFKERSEDNAGLLAAGIAFYTVFSLAPLLLLFIIVISTIFQTEAQNEILQQLAQVIGQEGVDIIRQLIEAIRQGSTIWATLITVAIVIFGSTRVFLAIQQSLHIIWGVDEDLRSNESKVVEEVQKRLKAFIIAILVGLLLFGVVFINTTTAFINIHFSQALRGVPILGSGLVNQIIQYLLILAILVVLFAVIYRVLPEIEIPWRVVWGGAAMSAVLFLIGQILIGLYIAYSSTTSIYGAAGSMMALVIWISYSAQVFMYGAELTKVYAINHGVLQDIQASTA